MELSALIKKIGHSLVEIRVRALKSVLSKLDHSLISIHDVVQEKMLFVYLLEWFNFPEVPMSNEVLDLLLTLSKHPSSAQMLRDVGAVDFLTQLSPNVKPRQRAVIDGTLDQLFMLPDLLPSQTDVYSHGPQNAALTAPAVVLPEENSSETGFFHKNTSSDQFVPIQRISANESVRCLKFSVFPWLTLTNTDRHILSSNESSLGSNNPNLVRTTCELLCDVIMQDFPAEIFLQRPNIAKKLLSLLKLSTGTGEGVAKYLHLAALSCLRQLCVELRKRLRFHQDPSFYSAKQDQFSQNSSFSCPQEVLGAQRSQSSSPGVEYSPRPSVVGRTGQRARGDGQDGDVASNSGSSQRLGAADRALTPADVATADLPDLGVENILELQFQQLTLAQFSVATVEHAIPILKTGLHVFQRALELLSDALLLLCESVSELVWDDHSLVGTELREKLRACLELLGDILCSHQSHSADISHIHQRMTYIGTAVFTLKLLQSVLPPEKASEHLPESTALAIFHLCLDSSLGSLLPSMQETAAAYLEQVNPDNHDLYRRVTRAALWMESTCNFIKEIQAEGEKNWLELLELADQSIDGLPFHQHLPVIQHCLNMCSYLWKFDQPSPLLQTESQKLLLKLLSHPLLPVRMETYKCTLRLVKDCLGIHNVSRQTQEVCAGVHFLLHRKLLYEIITFGLQDASEKVNVPAKDILLFLLQGRLMMTPSTWDRFTQALDPVMAVLQGYASTDDSLGNCVLLISDTSAEAKDDGFPRLAKLRASLRLLFSSQPRVRTAAVQQLVPQLKSSDTVSRPEVDQPVISSLSNIYCLTNSVDVSLGTSSKSVLKVESVEKLFSILQSDAVDLSLRRSAADQLAVVLQDTSMHLVLKNLGITDRVISFIEKSVNGDQSCDCLLEPSVCILRKLVYVDLALRHSLAQRDLLLLTLLRASMILKQNKANPSETAVLMTLLLFDEIARIELWSDQSNTFATLKPFSLPLVIIRRYNLPFQAATHHAVSPHCSVLPPSSDLQTLGPARQALQVAWNTAWFCGTEKLLEHLGCGNSDITEFHGDLKLSEAQVCSLKAVHLPTALQDCVQAIVRAAAHRSVAAVLSRLGLYLLIYRMVLPHTPTYSCKDVLQSLGWQAALTRFLQVRPACVEDEKLLVGIVAFLNAYFKHFYTELETDEEDGDLRWILELLLNQEGVSLLNLLLGVETQTSTQGLGEQEEQKNHISQRLQRELTGFFNTLLTCVTRTTDRMCLALGGPFKSQLAVRLLQSLRVSDAPRFYGLPSLERTLRGMVVLTAQPGWSSHCSDLEPSSLCSKYLSGLLEVISSFYVEWGENSLSFMGKGVTKNAIICLLHLSHEMMTVNKDKGENVISQWSLGNEAAAEETNTSHLGLAWLVPLWVDRDPEVRFASLGLGAALSSISSGCQALCASCQNISGGLWGTLLNILLDQQESSLVRTEAAFILQNLVVMPMPANAEEAKNSHWQHPCVHDEVSGVSLVGLPALQALLYHCHYFQHMLLSASSCYRSWYGFHFQPGADVGTGPSPQGSSSLDSETSLTLPTYAEPLTLSSSRLFSSLSTSSTVIRESGPHTPKAPSPSTVTEEMPSSRLMAQGQSETDTSDSVTSQDSCQDKPLAIGPVVIATPHLLTAHCGLLSNLLAVLPDFTLTAIRHNQLLQALASLVEFKAMEKCVTKMKTPSVLPGEKEDISSQFVTMLRFTSSFCKLLLSCVTVMSDETITHMDFFNPLLSSLVAVLTLNTQGLDAGSQHVVCVCWTDVFTLLAAVVKRDGSAAHPSVSAALWKRWRAFAGTLTLCLEEKLSDSRLHSAALKFISTVFTEETKRRNKEVPTSQSKPACSLSDVLIGPAATQLCDLLLQSFEKLTLQDPLKKLTAKALTTLMACSPTAQDFAATTGLIDSCVEQMKQIYSQLNLMSLRPSKASQRKKEEGYLKDARMTMEILRSALYCNDECKVAATDAHLTLALYALWPWLLLHDPTMEAALELLCVYTAHCTTACSALCGSGPAVVSGSKSSSTSSLMQSVMKLTSGFTVDYTPIHNLAFCLLTNLVQSRDCRGLLQKNNFLQAFLSVPMPKAAAVKAQSVGGGGGSLSAWLKLLLSVSLSEDGQQSILKVTGALELLVDLAPHRRHALLTLHNLCFNTANKSHLIANGNAIKVLLGSLENKEMETRCMGASALWALLHNNQRAKNTLKCPTVRLRIEEALTASKKDAEKKPGLLSSYLIKCLINLSQLLKD
ncbi:rotatin isoform X2 [Gouania willdenowi]|uniref:rotatin isoform X2 n=1 Tax=Gouania willdenowi TaxID=441366 RepID=UPI0010563F4F|nr:rotatin isoform X2 [Gouania willdenowi]